MDRSSNTSSPKHLAVLVAWLNSPRIQEVASRTGNPVGTEEEANRFRDSLTRERIEPVIYWLNDITMYSRYRQNRKQLVGMDLKRDIVNSLLRNCLVFPQLVSSKPGTEPTVRWLPDPNANDDQRNFIECLQAILYAFDRGWLSRVHRCAYEPCGRWFEAKDPRKRFHSATCKKRSYSASSKSKQKKRIYMRRYMRKYRNELYGKGN